MHSIHYERSPDADEDMLLNLNLGDLFINDRERVAPFTRFMISSYTKVMRDDEMVQSNTEGLQWGSAFRLINDFFTVCPRGDQEKIATFLISSNARIKQFIHKQNSATIIKLLDEIREDLAILDREVDLLPKLTAFCTSRVPIPDMPEAGNRAQDSDILTFRYQDICTLMGVVALTKFLTPVFGEIMYALQKLKADGKRKELFAAVITNRLLDNRCPMLIDKLMHYIRHNVTKSFNPDKTAIHHSITTNSLSGHIFSCLLVRNYVNLDPYRKNSQLMTYTSVAIRRAADSQAMGISHRQVMSREDKSANKDDDSKKSNLEIDSLVSHRTGDTPIIVAVGLDKIIGDLCHTYSIGMHEFNEVLKHNLESGVFIHNINKPVVFNSLGAFVGGARSVSTLSFNDMAKAITLVQLMCFQSGYYELGHAITAKVGTLVNTTRSSEDGLVITDATMSNEFRVIRSRLEDSLVTPRSTAKRFVLLIKDLAESAVTHVYLYNTADILWRAGGLENMNGKQIQFTPALIRGICSMFEKTMERA